MRARGKGEVCCSLEQLHLPHCTGPPRLDPGKHSQTYPSPHRRPFPHSPLHALRNRLVHLMSPVRGRRQSLVVEAVELEVEVEKERARLRISLAAFNEVQGADS